MTAINHPAADVPMTFWQHPFVQNILPFLTSLMTHVAILVIALATYTVIKIETQVTQIQTDPAQMPIDPSDNPNMPDNLVAHVGRGDNPMLDDAQEKILEVKVSGFTEFDGKDKLSMLAPGGGLGNAASAGLIGLGVGNGFGKGTKGWGSGIGDGNGPGNGPGGGTLPFGPPGGIPGKKFINSPLHGGRIVFICDATGSMIPEFDNLRVELRKTIEGLRLPQSFNVVFFQENAPPPLDKNLLLSTPDSKRRMFDYIDKYTAKGPTDPKPAIIAAIAMHPDLVFFLCDPSDFPNPKEIRDLFRTLNADGKCRVNTIDFMGDLNDEAGKAGETLLKQISAESKGTFSYVSEKDLGD